MERAFWTFRCPADCLSSPTLKSGFKKTLHSAWLSTSKFQDDPERIFSGCLAFVFCISAWFHLAEEAGGQRHVQVSPHVSGSLCTLDDNVSGDTILKAQVQRKTNSSTLMPTSMETPNEFRRPCWQYFRLLLSSLWFQGLCLQAHAERRAFELNVPRRKLSKAQINYLQQHLNNYYYVMRLPVRPFGTSIRKPQTTPSTQHLSCKNPFALK